MSLWRIWKRVLDVYKRPYDKDYPVVCMDESPKQLIEEGRPSTAMKPYKLSFSMFFDMKDNLCDQTVNLVLNLS